MKRGRLVALLVAAVAVIAVASVAVTLLVTHRAPAEAAAPEAVAVTVPVPVAAKGLPKDTTIGVLLPLGESGEAGTEFATAAQGAVVAAERLRQAGNPVSLAVQNDGGSDSGAAAAVEKLRAAGVSGLVIAETDGRAAAAAKAASAAGIPAVAPYADVTGKGVYSLAPSAAEFKDATASATRGAKNVLLVDAGAGAPAGVTVGRTLKLSDFDDVQALATEAAVLTGDRLRQPGRDAPQGSEPSKEAHPSDTVLISSPLTARSALVVQALQAKGVSVPLVLGQDATSPLFATSLQEHDGAASGQLVGVAAVGGDSVALQQDDAGRAMSAFLAGVRMAAADPSLKNLSGDAPFADDAWAADARSHDAVLSLALAAAQARSTAPAKVAEALAALAPGAKQGIAEGPLDFTRPHVMTRKAVPVYASEQDLGLRPRTQNSPTLIWIPAASGGR